MLLHALNTFSMLHHISKVTTCSSTYTFLYSQTTHWVELGKNAGVSQMARPQKVKHVLRCPNTVPFCLCVAE